MDPSRVPKGGANMLRMRRPNRYDSSEKAKVIDLLLSDLSGVLDYILGNRRWALVAQTPRGVVLGRPNRDNAQIAVNRDAISR